MTAEERKNRINAINDAYNSMPAEDKAIVDAERRNLRTLRRPTTTIQDILVWEEALKNAADIKDLGAPGAEYAKLVTNVTTRIVRLKAGDLIELAGEKTRKCAERGPLTKYQEYQVWTEVLDAHDAKIVQNTSITFDLTSDIKFTMTPGIREYVVTEDMLAKPKEE
jgi:hypothetical protein